MNRLRSALVWLMPLISIGVGYAAHLGGMETNAAITLGIGLLTAVWWMSEAVPIAAASLVPLAFLPLFGVLSDKTGVAQSFGHPLILLLLGGFLLSKGMEKSGVHRRLAIGMVRLCGGGSGKGLILGFMLAAAILSMWISNTATCLMLLPIGLAVMEGIREDGQSTARVAAPLMMGIAFASNIGGLGTPIGTPPNLVFIEQYAKLTGTTMTFTGWMTVGIPVVITMIPLMWLWLSRGLSGSQKIQLPDCGPWRVAEKRTLWVFGFTAVAWMIRVEPFGGWSAWLGLTTANDASVAFVGTLLLFCISDGSGREGDAGRLLDWKTAVQIPWGILLLFSSGICLATGFSESGLSAMAANGLTGIGTLPVIGMIVVICLVMTFLTEMTSNTASTILMMPILGAAAVAAGIDPKLLMLPAALSASCAFMLPVATGPNAVVFGSGHLTVPTMAREGLVLNLMGVVVVSFWCWLLG